MTPISTGPDARTADRHLPFRRRRQARAGVVIAAGLIVSACTADAERPVVVADVGIAESLDAARFETVGDPFRTAARCQAHLAKLVAFFPQAGFEIARGPYTLEPSDVRAHAVRADAEGHVVAEYRCLGADLQARSWRQRLPGEGVRPFTLEDIKTMTFPSQPESEE